MRKRVELERIDIAHDQADFVRRRVRPFIVQHPDRALTDLLCDAYCQGLTDAADAAALARAEASRSGGEGR